METIINRLKEEFSYLTKKEIKEIISTYEEVLLSTAKEEGKVRTKIGIIKTVKRKGRKGRTPQGKEYDIPERDVIVYKISKKRQEV